MYWGKGSQYAELKAYPKGPHLRGQVHSGLARASDEQLLIADRLLRLEASFRPKHLKTLDQPWYDLTPSDLLAMHRRYFSKVVPKELFANTNSLEGVHTSPRPLRQFIEALQTDGLVATRATTSKSTWHRRVTELRAMGLTPAQVAASGSNAPCLSFSLDAPVRSWEECQAATASELSATWQELSDTLTRSSSSPCPLPSSFTASSRAGPGERSVCDPRAPPSHVGCF